MTPTETLLATAEPTTFEELDRQVADLRTHCIEWARLPMPVRIAYLVGLRRNTARLAERWARTGCEAKGIPWGTPMAGEEWTSGPWAMLYAINRLVETLTAIEADGVPSLGPKAIHTRSDGQVVVDVFPQSMTDRLLLSGVRAEVWMEAGVTEANLRGTMAVFYRKKDPAGSVSLVLGAGNVASIAPLDVLYKLYAEGSVCLLKMNPVNEYLGPLMEEIFADLVRDGYVHVAYGGAQVGAHLCEHEGIDEIHMTGSDRTHDAIVFGVGEEGQERKRARQPRTTKRITTELGNVSPTIIVPGPWSAADIQFQAEHIATQKLHNSGHNCVAAQVLVVDPTWDLLPGLLDAVREVMRSLPPRPTYYPGATERVQHLAETHTGAEELTPVDDLRAARILVTGLDPDAPDTCFRTEAFAPLLAETEIVARDTDEFLTRAVAFCNEKLWGTLGANILVHPTTMKEHAAALDLAIAGLRYGSVAVNTWTGVGFLLAQTTWGAFPGHTMDDIQSGVGVVHNSLLFDRAQKSVVYAPFQPFPRGAANGHLEMLPKPPWFVTNKQAHVTARRLVAFEAAPSSLKLPGIFAAALRG
ncbi:MAG: aldehyde dehydrogenase family protein [Candidatus Dormibacteria bacterium]